MPKITDVTYDPIAEKENEEILAWRAWDGRKPPNSFSMTINYSDPNDRIHGISYEKARTLIIKGEHFPLSHDVPLPLILLPNSEFYQGVVQAFLSHRPSFLQPLFHLSEFDLGGHNSAIGSPLYIDYLFHRGAKVKTSPSHLFGEILASKSLETAKKDIDWKQFSFLRMQGRTALFKHQDNKEYLLALKIQKIAESEEDLLREYTTLTELHAPGRKKPKLKSQLPMPVFCQHMPKKDLESLTSQTLPNTTDTCMVYAYTASPDYFVYLHDKIISHEDFKTTNQRVVTDLFTLLKQGMVLNQLADIFHTHSSEDRRSDKGRYIVLVDMLRYLNFFPGRVNAWEKAIEYVNLRLSGVADWADWKPLSEFLTHSKTVKLYYSEILEGISYRNFCDEKLFNNKGRKFGNFIHANIMAEYLFVLHLVAGKRALELTQQYQTEQRSQKEIDALWKEVGQQMHDNAALAISIMTGMSQERAARYLARVVNFDSYSQQMQFWMTLRRGVFIPQAQVEETLKRIYPGAQLKQLRDIKGEQYSHDGVNMDLGGYNQFDPTHEAHKLFSTTIMLIELFDKTDDKFRDYLDEYDRQFAEGHFEQAFAMLKKVTAHCRPHHRNQYRFVDNLYKELLSKTSDTTLLAAIEQSQKECKQTWAALTIQSSSKRFFKKSILTPTIELTETIPIIEPPKSSPTLVAPKKTQYTTLFDQTLSRKNRMPLSNNKTHNIATSVEALRAKTQNVKDANYAQETFEMLTALHQRYSTLSQVAGDKADKKATAVNKLIIQLQQETDLDKPRLNQLLKQLKQDKDFTAYRWFGRKETINAKLATDFGNKTGVVAIEYLIGKYSN